MTTLTIASVLQVALLSAAPEGFDAAAQRSTESGRPLVVLLGADWCPACKVMKNKTLPRAAEAGALANVEFAYVDVDHQRDLAGRLIRGKSIPQLIRFEKTENGWQPEYLIGAHSPDKVAQFIDPTAKPLSKFSFSGFLGLEK